MSDICGHCGHSKEDHEPDGECWNGSGSGNRCDCREFVDENGLKEYEISVVYTMMGKYKIKAKDLQDAIDQVEDPAMCLPDNADYLEDSFRIDTQFLREEYPDEFDDVILTKGD